MPTKSTSEECMLRGGYRPNGFDEVLINPTKAAHDRVPVLRLCWRYSSVCCVGRFRRACWRHLELYIPRTCWTHHPRFCNILCALFPSRLVVLSWAPAVGGEPSMACQGESPKFLTHWRRSSCTSCCSFEKKSAHLEPQSGSFWWSDKDWTGSHRSPHAYWRTRRGSALALRNCPYSAPVCLVLAVSKDKLPSQSLKLRANLMLGRGKRGEGGGVETKTESARGKRSPRHERSALVFFL